ncbi:MAG: polypeptide deformylase [Gammaproteobacteria bacterium]|nr:polypeptide deformylase [Gammaproteobacteria bacterium]
MTVLTVLHFPDPNLRKKAVAIEVIDAEVKILAQDLLETMYAEKGIGLAATQANVQRRLIVMDLSEEKNNPVIMINPEITASEGTEEMQEGCLSVPGFYETVQRSEKINYHYLDLNGDHISGTADGLLAVCVQHEIDHLNGKLFIDYLSPLKRRIIQKKILKQDKQPQQLL